MIDDRANKKHTEQKMLNLFLQRELGWRIHPTFLLFLVLILPLFFFPLLETILLSLCLSPVFTDTHICKFFAQLLSIPCTHGKPGAAAGIRVDPLMLTAFIVRAATPAAWNGILFQGVITDILSFGKSPSGRFILHHHLLSQINQVPNLPIGQATEGGDAKGRVERGRCVRDHGNCQGHKQEDQPESNSSHFEGNGRIGGNVKFTKKKKLTKRSKKAEVLLLPLPCLV